METNMLKSGRNIKSNRMAHIQFSFIYLLNEKETNETKKPASDPFKVRIVLIEEFHSMFNILLLPRTCEVDKRSLGRGHDLRKMRLSG